MQLRPYQRECVDAVYDHLRTRDDNPCAVVPTAGGKTPIMATICKDAVGHWNGRVLILAHVKELLEQTADKLRAVCHIRNCWKLDNQPAGRQVTFLLAVSTPLQIVRKGVDTHQPGYLCLGELPSTTGTFAVESTQQ